MAAVIALVGLAGTIGMAISERRTREVARVAQIGLFVGSYVKEATVHHNAREHERAIAMLREAVAISEAVPATNPLVRRQVYKAHYNLAEYYFETNRTEEAIPHCNKAVELSEAFRQEDPNDLEWIRLGSYSRRLSGRVAYAQEQWGEALRHFTIMHKARADLAALEPDVPYRKVELADAHNWVGKAARKARLIERAIQHHKMACSILAGLLDSDPEMADYAIRLSNAELRLSIDYMNMREADQIALETLARARNRLTELQVKDPGLQNRVADILDSLDKNMAIVNRRVADG